MTHYAAEYGCEDPRDQHNCKELCPHTNVGTHAGKNCLRLNKQYQETKPHVYTASMQCVTMLARQAERLVYNYQQLASSDMT